MDVFKVGVSLAMTSNVAGVLSLIGRELTGVHMKVDALQGKFSRLHLAMGGAVAIAGAGGLLGAYVKLVEKGAELVHQQEQMKVAGMSNVDVQKSYAKSLELTRRYQNVGIVDINKIIGETRLPYGSSGTAINMAEPAVAFTSIMKAKLGKEAGDKAAEQMFQLVRSGEMRNISLDPRKMTQFFDDASKVIEAFEGKIDPNAFFQFLKYARTNTPYLSERFVTKIAPSLMLEMGDSSAGTALTSLSQAVIAGKMTKRSAEEMIRLGLIDPKSVLKTTTTSTQLKPGAVKGWRVAASDPDIWAQQVLLPTLLAHGIKDPVQQRLEFGVIFGNRTAENMANVLATQATRINKDAGMIGQAQGLPGAQELLKNDPMVVMQSIMTQWNNVLINLGKPNVVDAVRGMGAIAGALAKMATYAGQHPKVIKYLGEASLVIAAVLGVVGTVALGAAAFGAIASGGVIATMIAVVGGITAGAAVLAALNWNKVGGAVKAFGTFVWDVVKVMGAFVSNPLGAVMNLPKVAQQLGKDAAAGVAAWIAAHPATSSQSPTGHAAPALRTPPPHRSAAPSNSAATLHATIPVSIGNEHLKTFVVKHTARAVEHSLHRGGRNSDPTITPAYSGSVPMGTF